MAFAMIVTVIGFLLLLDKAGLVSGDVWGFFWPILIIAIGVSMMYNRMDRHACWCGSWDARAQPKQPSTHRKSAKRH